MKQLAGAELAAFRKLDSTAQLAQMRGQKEERTFTVERDAIDKESRTAWFSIASERVYSRWWGDEILDHRKDSIRTERLDNGANFLVGHDTSDVVGVVDDWEISSEKKLRILVRFGRSARAEEIFQDVLDGIRRNTSVGYIIHDLILEKSEEGVNTYRVNDWEVLEGSLVAVPADPSVGQGRALELPANERNNEMTPEEQKIHDAKVRADARAEFETEQRDKEKAQLNTPAAVLQRERDRVSGIEAAGQAYSDLGGVEIAREVAKDPNGTVDGFKARMADAIRSKTKPLATAEAGATNFGEGARQVILRGRKLRAFKDALHFTDGSKMESLECAYRSGQWLLATVGQNERAIRWCKDHNVDIQQRVMTTDAGATGGYLVPTEMEQSIIDLREAYGLARRLARRRPMSTDTKSVPKRAGGVTAYFINEDNAGVTASDKNWANVNFAAKTLAALSLISRNLEEDSIIDTVDDLAQEMAYAFALKEDQCWLIGDGTSTYGGMQGLITLMEATAYASRIVAVSGHDLFSEIDNVDLTSVHAGVADFPGIEPTWLCSKTFAESVMNRLKATAGGNNIQSLESRPKYNYLGYDAYTSEIMPKVLTTLNAKVMALFGDFSMSSSFGDRRGITIQVLRERYAEKLQVGILADERFHIVNHDLGSTTVKGPVAALYGN